MDKNQKMDHSASFRQPLSILRSCCSCNCTRTSDIESQIIPSSERNVGGIVPRDSIIVADNNNYLTSAIDSCSGSSDPQLIRWSSYGNWTRKVPPLAIPQRQHHRKWWCFGITSFLSLILIVIGILLVTHYLQHAVSGTLFNGSTPTSTIDIRDVAEVTTTIPRSQIKNRKIISKHAWFALQKNDARHVDSGEDPIVFSISKDKVHRIPCGREPFRTPCCKLEKSMELLEYPGCAPIEVPRHVCVGGCDYVFVEGNPYVSIPKCQPVRTRKLKFKLICGGEVRRVAREVASRCRCA